MQPSLDFSNIPSPGEARNLDLSEEDGEAVILPVITLLSPHPPSMPLLLLFSFGDQTQVKTKRSRNLSPIEEDGHVTTSRLISTSDPETSSDSEDIPVSFQDSPSRSRPSLPSLPRGVRIEARHSISSTVGWKHIPRSVPPTRKPRVYIPPHPHLLITYLLPAAAIAELPAYTTASQVMSNPDVCSDEEFQAYAELVQGFFHNCLRLSPKDKGIFEDIKLARDVVNRAARIRSN